MVMSITMVYPDQLLCNGLENPIGVSTHSMLFEWKITGSGNNIRQIEYEIEISSDFIFNEESLFCRKNVSSSFTWFYAEMDFPEYTKFYWRVRVKLNENVWTNWSEAAYFETSSTTNPFHEAKWIEADDKFYKDADVLCRKFWKKNNELNFFAQTTPGEPESYPPEDQGLRRCPYLKKKFALDKEFDDARLYIAVRGFYELYINGRKVSNYALVPDFTAYDKCIYYQTYDIRNVIKHGVNEIEVILADGWFAGHAQSIPGSNHIYGERPALLLRMDIKKDSEKVLSLVSDSTFEAWTGPLLYADLFMGEYFDSSTDTVSYGTVEKFYRKDILIPQEGEGVKEILSIEATDLKKLSHGTLIVDFGQVLAGRERIKFLNEKGSFIKIEHSEILKDDGSGDICNVIPEAFPFHDQTNFIYVNNDDFLYEPQFSFQGFRYIKISGLTQELKKEHCKAVVLETAMKDMMEFRCSHNAVNQLCQNVLWSQRGNMISIPTDCPQRERAGFTGDAQIFCTTAAWNQNVYSFFRRWLKQCRLEQFQRGQIPITVPYTKGYSPGAPNPAWTSAGWGDAILFVPWDLYRAYGKKEILEENYGAMEKWMSYVRECAEESMPERYYLDERRRWQKYLWNSGYHWGDWLMPGYSAHEGVALTKEITASLYYFREVTVMLEIVKTLNLVDKEAYYSELRENIRKAFHMFYITDKKLLTTDLQGMYVMAIAFGMVHGEEKITFAKRLNELVMEQGYHLATGFLSTPYLLDVLWECGYCDTAERVLFQDTCPSWLYEVKKGATTIWESWNDKNEENGDIISSYNHYAYGTVCDFIYRRFTGIQKYLPGFEKVWIRLEKISGIKFVNMKYETPWGELKINWNIEVDNPFYKLVIPNGMTVEIETANGRVEAGSGEWSFMLNSETLEIIV